MILAVLVSQGQVSSVESRFGSERFWQGNLGSVALGWVTLGKSGFVKAVWVCRCWVGCGVVWQGLAVVSSPVADGFVKER